MKSPDAHTYAHIYRQRFRGLDAVSYDPEPGAQKRKPEWCVVEKMGHISKKGFIQKSHIANIVKSFQQLL